MYLNVRKIEAVVSGEAKGTKETWGGGENKKGKVTGT